LQGASELSGRDPKHPVTAGLDPAVHAERGEQKVQQFSPRVAAAWIAGSSPAMTKRGAR
jgi:hypothetical protein